MSSSKAPTHLRSCCCFRQRVYQTAIECRWLRRLLPIAGLLAAIWFLIRVVPKPGRAAYPCQRVALPLASGFVGWLVGGVVTVVLARKSHALLRGARRMRVAGILGLIGAAAIITIVYIPLRFSAADSGAPANGPMGVARGIHPGRVVWVHDPEATDWEGTDASGGNIGDGYWWESEHTGQEVVDHMFDRAIRALAGKGVTRAAWEAMFRHFNQTHGKGDVGYQSGEKITVKVNLVTSLQKWANVDADGNQTTKLGFVNTSPQMILALLRQLVYVVGVDQGDITVGDPLCWFPNHYWDHCQPEFPGVDYVQCLDAWGRRGRMSSQGAPDEAVIYWSTSEAAGTTPDYLLTSYVEAAYLINFACLKAHTTGGVTLCAKNHYGSLDRYPHTYGYYQLHASLPSEASGTGYYRAHVDITGYSHLGGKTLLYLIDGLYGAFGGGQALPLKWELPPFGDGAGGADWPSSLFASSDPVAVDSVAYDFLLAEWPDRVTSNGSFGGGEEDYLHEAALADDPPSGTHYDPDGTRVGLSSLGVHEHWNNSIDKQYTRNLGISDGIELLAVNTAHNGDFDGDTVVSLGDFHHLHDCLAGPTTSPAPTNPVTRSDCLAAFDFDFDADVDLSDFGVFQISATGSP